MLTDPPVAVATAREAEAARLARLATLVHFLDTAVRIPGTRLRFGADAVIGLVPGLGDLVGGLCSALVITEAIRTHVPGVVVQRMFWNVAVDLIGGVVPVVGDAFDLFWKAGVRNLDLLAQYRDQPVQVAARSHRSMLWISAGVGLLAAVAMTFAMLLTFALIRWLTG